MRPIDPLTAWKLTSGIDEIDGSFHLSASEKMLVVLRDGRKLVGVLRSYDQFGEISSKTKLVSYCASQWRLYLTLWLCMHAPYKRYLVLWPIWVPTSIDYSHAHVQSANLVLEDTVERIHHATSYGDIPRGVFLIRGENVVLLGEIVSPFPPRNHQSLMCSTHYLPFHDNDDCGACFFIRTLMLKISYHSRQHH